MQSRIVLGTHTLKGQQAYTAVLTALQVGYRHIDTAAVYGNEVEVGNAIREFTKMQGKEKGEVAASSTLDHHHASHELGLQLQQQRTVQQSSGTTGSESAAPQQTRSVASCGRPINSSSSDCGSSQIQKIFVTSKLSPRDQRGYAASEAALVRSLRRLLGYTDIDTATANPCSVEKDTGCGYSFPLLTSLAYDLNSAPVCDCYLLHWPGTSKLKLHDPRNQQWRHEAWAVLAEAKRLGLVSSIGVSNFLIPHLEKLPLPRPDVIQTELHPKCRQTQLVEFCRRQHRRPDAKCDENEDRNSNQDEDAIPRIEAYSPLGSGALLDDKCSSAATTTTVTPVANDPSAADVVKSLLEWSCRQGFVPVVRSTNRDHLAFNLAVVCRYYEEEEHEGDVESVDGSGSENEDGPKQSQLRAEDQQIDDQQQLLSSLKRHRGTTSSKNDNTSTSSSTSHKKLMSDHHNSSTVTQPGESDKNKTEKMEKEGREKKGASDRRGDEAEEKRDDEEEGEDYGNDGDKKDHHFCWFADKVV